MDEVEVWGMDEELEMVLGGGEDGLSLADWWRRWMWYEDRAYVSWRVERGLCVVCGQRECGCQAGEGAG